MAAGDRAQKFCRRLASKITIIESGSVIREDDGRSRLSPEVRTRHILPVVTVAKKAGANEIGAKEFIWNPGLRNVKDDSISRQRMFQNKVGRRTRSVALVVKVVAVDEENSL